MPAIHDSFRFDFKVAILERDERSGLVRFGLVPDPDRYEWIEHDGERALFDRFDRYIIPERVLAEAAPTLEGLPSFFAPPLIKSAADYVESRGEPIARRLAGEVPASELADPSGEFLAELAGLKHDFAIISIDLVGSTPLSASLSGDDYERLIEMFLAELSAVVPLFRGHVPMPLTASLVGGGAALKVDLLGQEMGQGAPQIPADLHVSQSCENRLKPRST